MRIYTEVNFEWDDKKNKLVETSSESYEYSGEMALCEEGWQEDRIYDSTGVPWTVRYKYGKGKFYKDAIVYMEVLNHQGQKFYSVSDDIFTSDNARSVRLQNAKDFISTGREAGSSGWGTVHISWEGGGYAEPNRPPELDDTPGAQEIATEGAIATEEGDDDPVKTIGETSDFGAPNLSYEDFMKMSPDELTQWIIDTEYGGANDATLRDTHNTSRQQILTKLEKYMPRKEEIDPYALKHTEDLYGRTYGGKPLDRPSESLTFPGIFDQPDQWGGWGPGEDGIYGTEDDPGGYKGRSAGLTYEGALSDYVTAGLTYEGAGSTYGLAGLSYEAAGTTYKGAGHTLESTLGGLSESAYGQLGETPGGDIATRRKLKSSFESAYDVYGIAGERYETAGDIYDIAGDVYDRAGETYDMAGETYIDPTTGQERLGTLGLAGQTYETAEVGADLDWRAKTYGLELGTEQDWEANWLSFLDTLS